tara:strand:- start:361 stop:837 length:477 start_codon:yes stop_codon:yes gene_type:complete
MRSLFFGAIVFFIGGCASEPSRIVDSSSSDGRFKITLEATNDWARPGQTIPVKVRLERLGEVVLPEEEINIIFSTFNGDVNPSTLNPVFVDTASERFSGVIKDDSIFETWVEFTPDSRPEELQAELNARIQTTWPDDGSYSSLGHVKLRIRISEAKTL